MPRQLGRGVGRQQPTRRLSLALIVGFSVLCATACDGYLGMTGFVYEDVSATAKGDGLVVIDREGAAATTDDLKPVGGCDITLEPWTPVRRPDAETARLWTSRTKSDTNGRFELGGTARPGWYDATVSVSCPGFNPKTHVFRHDRLRHQATVTMVRRQQ